MIDVKKLFEMNQSLDSFHRVEDHPLDIYLGIDDMSRYTLFLISEYSPQNLLSSHVISLKVGIRKDGKTGISFSLTDDKYEDIFCHFCIDIIESSRAFKEKNLGIEHICIRYNMWQEMLAKEREGVLSLSAMKGLIGELYFFNSYILPNYGEEIALNSWIGPERADQDFICSDKWYEIKATNSGSECVLISSVEQLDSLQEGELVIVLCDKTSLSDSLKLTLNSLYNEIVSKLSKESSVNKFRSILLNIGYFERKEYDNYAFRITGINRYYVTSTFPCIRRANLPSSILNTRYDLSVAALTDFSIG